MKASSIAKQSKIVAPPAAPPRVEAANVLREGVTIETLAYGAIVVLAAALRIINLGAAPLTSAEAAQALAALHGGTALPTGGSPLLYALNQIVLSLSGSSLGDAGVRIGAALIGTLLVLMPRLYRNSIGRIGALAAAMILAISPTLVFASRQIDGQLIATTCALAAFGFGARYGETRRARDLNAAAIAIGLALTSGPGVYTVLIVIALGAIVAYRWLLSAEDREALTDIRQDVAALRQAALYGGVTMLLVATVGALNFDAARGVPELLTAWLAAWRAPDTIGPLQVFQVLLMYEPLIVGVGLAGLIVGLRRLSGSTAVLGVWSIGALLIGLAQPGRQLIDLALVLAPLALLAGCAIQRLSESLLTHGSWSYEGALWLVSAPLFGYLAITLSGYATGHNVIGSAQLLGQTMTPLISFVVLVLILTLIIGGVFALAIGVKAVLRGGAVMLIGVLAVITVGVTWSVTQLHPGDPRELLWGPTATTVNVRPLIDAVRAASNRATGHLTQAAVTVALPQIDPVIAWYLRDFKNARFSATPDADAPIVITPLGLEPPAEPGAYLGAKFITRSMWSPSALDDAALLRWWVYREAADPTPVQTLVVWVKPPS